MKTKYITAFTILSLFFSMNLFAQKTEEIKVWGNCGMCKKTIEAAALKAGASVANWNKETKVLTVEFKERKTNAQKIQESIANAGYDTQDVTAPADSYGKLPECCQYSRKETDKKQ